MRKSVTISEKEYELVTNAYTSIAYKSEFGKDFFQDLFGMISNQNIMQMAENGNNEVDINMLANFDMTFFNRLFWVFTKSGNRHIKPYEQFFMEMEEFPLQDIAPILMEMINETMIFTVESYLSCCKETGLTIDDLKHISIGMALDYQTDYVNLRTENKSETRKATQSDFDSF